MTAYIVWHCLTFDSWYCVSWDFTNFLKIYLYRVLFHISWGTSYQIIYSWFHLLASPEDIFIHIIYICFLETENHHFSRYEGLSNQYFSFFWLKHWIQLAWHKCSYINFQIFVILMEKKIWDIRNEKSLIWETLNLFTCADCSTLTNKTVFFLWI